MKSLQQEWTERGQMSEGMKVTKAAWRHMCNESCQQHTHTRNHLMTKPAGSTLSLVSSYLSHSHYGVGSVLTSRTRAKSIHQAAVMTMSEAAAGWLQDRCAWRIAPPALALARHPTFSLSFPLTHSRVRLFILAGAPLSFLLSHRLFKIFFLQHSGHQSSSFASKVTSLIFWKLSSMLGHPCGSHTKKKNVHNATALLHH